MATSLEHLQQIMVEYSIPGYSPFNIQSKGLTQQSDAYLINRRLIFGSYLLGDAFLGAYYISV